MTRTGGGRGPNSATGRGGPAKPRPSAAKNGGRASGASSGAGGRHRTSRRTRAMQLAALAFVVLLIVASMVGCAKYNGDKAAFCAQLRDVPSFAQLSARVNTGSAQQASATMRGAAAEFRALEREAPRTIRHTVAALGDSAERIADKLAPHPSTTTPMTIRQSDGSTLVLPYTPSVSQGRLGVFYDELQHHHGTVSAMNSLDTYARDDCGIEDGKVDLSLFGYGDQSDQDGPGMQPGARPPQERQAPRYPAPTVVIPPATSTP